MSKKKSHARAADKKGFSVALPIKLIDDVQDIADKETRSRNQQIEVFLKESVARYNDAASIEGQSKAGLSLVAEDEPAYDAPKKIIDPAQDDLDEQNANGGETNTAGKM